VDCLGGDTTPGVEDENEVSCMAFSVAFMAYLFGRYL
jgi:hypothetical protein